MKRNDIQVGVPLTIYTDTQSNIEAISSPTDGMIAYAYDTDTYLFYDGADWSQAGGSGDVPEVTYSGWNTITGGISGSSYAWKGSAFRCTKTHEVAGMYSYGNWNTGHRLKLGIYRMSGNTIAEIMYKTAANRAPSWTGKHWHTELFFDSPVTLTAGYNYWFACGHTTSGGSYALPISYPNGSSSVGTNYVYHISPWSWRIASADPLVGNGCGTANGTAGVGALKVDE